MLYIAKELYGCNENIEIPINYDYYFLGNLECLSM